MTGGGMEAISREGFGPHWRVEVLAQAPMIAPVRQFTYPQRIVGEEEAQARGALVLMARPIDGSAFLAVCTLGFTDPTMPTGVYACPDPKWMCAVAGGYAYLVNMSHPETCFHLPMRPVVEVKVLVEQRMLLFVGFHTMAAWGETGLMWETERLSWEGIRIESVEGMTLEGMGWDLMADKELSFTVDLATGLHQGGSGPVRRG
jgi:hypothetical protein